VRIIDLSYFAASTIERTYYSDSIHDICLFREQALLTIKAKYKPFPKAVYLPVICWTLAPEATAHVMGIENPAVIQA
jgi:hypothetical protein